MRTYLLLGTALAICAPIASYAQETTAELRGAVTADGSPVSGAEVIITHVPSGTVSRTTTGADGNFGASGLRYGGPFTVTVTASGYESASIGDLFLTAGDVARIPIELAGAGEAAGQPIVVIGSRLGGSSVSLGPVTVLNRDSIEGVATINRDVRDLIRRSPFAQVDLSNSRAFSIAGQNPRFNRFSVDGVQFTDDFGLNSGGLPTSRGPVPLDAICQFTVAVAPADISEGDFQGGAVNTQLCSGTNRFQGGAFYTYNDDSLIGDQAENQRVLLNVRNQAYGAFLRGPIIRDRLFFAAAWERTRETEPTDFGPQGEGFGNPIPAVTRTDVDLIRQIAQSLYQYDPGDVVRSLPEEDDRVTAKIDWNISDDHRAALTYIYNNGIQRFGSSNSTSVTAPRLGLFSNSYAIQEVVHSGVLQINSDWTENFSTEARIAYRDYARDQTPPLGREFGEFSVCLDPVSAGSAVACTSRVGVIRFGPDISRQANELDTTNLSVQFQANFRSGAHNFKALAARTHIDVRNFFLQRASGAFYFDSVADFRAGRAGLLDLAQSTTGDISDAAADYSYDNYTFGVQDSWDINDTMNVVLGLRYEMFNQDVRPRLNEFFRSRYGFGNNITLNGLGIVLPRFGFSWRPVDRLRLIATAGRYAAGTPDVWVSNSYSNTGISQNRVTFNRQAAAPGCSGVPASLPEGPAICAGALDGVFDAGPGIPGIVTQFVQRSTAALAQAGVNAIDPDFGIPNQWRVSASLSYNADLGPLGDEWFFGLDGILGWVGRSIDYVDLRSVPIGTAPDGRPRFGAFPGTSGNNSDFLLTNAREGRTLILVARFDKAFDNGLSLGAAYTFQDITERSPLTSSVAFTNYSSQATSNPNGSSLGTSNEQVRHAVRFNVGFRREFFANAETRFDLFGEWRQGRPFSYTFDTIATAGRDPVFGVFGNDDRHLIYVPTGGNDPLVSFASAAEQAAFEALVANSPLSRFRGRIAPKNIARNFDFTKIDLRLSQEIPTFGFGRIRLFADFENFLNLLNRNWGSLRQVNFPYYAPVADVQCLTTAVPTGTSPTGAQVATSSTQTCAQYRYSNVRSPDQTLLARDSLWQLRVGIRFEF